MIKVTALDHVSLGATNVEALADFYVRQWGLQLVEGEADRSAYLRTEQGGHHALVLEHAERSGLTHLAFEVAERDDLQRAVEQAEASGVPVVARPGHPSEPGHRDSARLADPDGNVVELIWAPERIRDAFQARHVKPRKLGHVVLNTPDHAAMEHFYGRLGFRVTDRTARGMSFMRSIAGDHHTLALVQSPRTGVQHVAYDVVALDNVMRALGTFKREGLPCIWGPGRHGPGNNIFTYYTDPEGTIIEYYAELEQVFDEAEEQLEERFWGPDWSGDQWGLAGPPPARFSE